MGVSSKNLKSKKCQSRKQSHKYQSIYVTKHRDIYTCPSQVWEGKVVFHVICKTTLDRDIKRRATGDS
jgi:hypothetical protein